MVLSYLRKLQDEFIQEKLKVENEITDLTMKLKQNKELLYVLEEKLIYKSKCAEKIEELSDIITKVEECMKENSRQYDLVDNSGYYRHGLTLLETRENEKQRISRDLHDCTVQNLTALVHKAELCSNLVDMDSVRCKLELSMMSKTLRDIINDMRQIIYNLHPMSFDDIGLDITIEHALDKMENASGKKINFIVEGEAYQIKSVVGITLLRIIQEGCSNAIKHADASYIQVVLKYMQEMISIIIEDNGKGFDTGEINTKERDDNSGLGLSIMKERVYLLSGNIEIESKINEGTKIIVNVPVKNGEDY